MSRMNSKVPARKVTAAALAAAVTQLLIWSLTDEGVLGLMDVPTHVETAISTIVAFTIGYLVPPSKNDHVVDSANYAA